jgi:hypothetical protein
LIDSASDPEMASGIEGRNDAFNTGAMSDAAPNGGAQTMQQNAPRSYMPTSIAEKTQRATPNGMSESTMMADPEARMRDFVSSSMF